MKTRANAFSITVVHRPGRQLALVHLRSGEWFYARVFCVSRFRRITFARAMRLIGAVVHVAETPHPDHVGVWSEWRDRRAARRARRAASAALEGARS